ncbi:RNA 2',3'-cyclic phosphodiesterase [Candidatus Tokpelaia sp.]|uniref:RNA 2',3'-cyclic phosphodiesterase n=1 Tax=Candidatus Tokpelaia sp. TaxID=2233777 RepID=UPI00123B3E6C|nr:RNA 2',3'-cyclic phosphodiesterase [Candidatus Tokpelaia sp.]KAA6406223.1 RNA 2',3'-cyclic phosphodiesterase [Candidatus Tokpelaia sp.]
MPRLFAAIEIPPEAVLSLSLLRFGLSQARNGWAGGRANNNVRWIDPADYHITLRFYGDVSFETADEIVAALDRLRCRSFALALKGVHVFSPKKPHSLYAGIAAAAKLVVLQEKIEHVSRRIVPPEPRKFTPHVTLARFKQADERSLAAWLSQHGNFTVLPWVVDRFCLMSSKDSTGGGPYVIEESWPLA